jgi:hypothetical protein
MSAGAEAGHVRPPSGDRAIQISDAGCTGFGPYCGFIVATKAQ